MTQPPVLIRLCEEQQWDLASDRLSLYPHEASYPLPLLYLSSPAATGVKQTIRRQLLRQRPCALSIACQNNAPLPFVRQLHLCCPEQVHIVGRDFTPVHDAIRFFGDMGVVRYLLEVDFESYQNTVDDDTRRRQHQTVAAIPDHRGRLPLHHLLAFYLRCQAPPSSRGCQIKSVLSLLLEIYPEGAAARDSDGRTPLHSILLPSTPTRDMCGESVESRIVDTTIAMVQCHPLCATICDNAGRTPLHLALFKTPSSPDVVRALLEAHPGAVWVPSREPRGALPIHAAVTRRTMETEVVRMLLEVDAKTATAPRRSGGGGESAVGVMTPLHCSFARLLSEFRSGGQVGIGKKKQDLDDEPLRGIVEAVRKNEFNQKDFVTTRPLLLGDSVLETIEGLPLETRRGLLRPCLDAMHVPLLLCAAYHGTTSKDLSLPTHGEKFRLVHAAVGVPSCPRPILRMALALHPEQLLERDEHGRIPLHVACSEEVVGMLSPWRCKIGRVVEYTEENEVSVVDMLLRRCPQAARIVNERGKLPLHLAIERGKKGAISFGPCEKEAVGTAEGRRAVSESEDNISGTVESLIRAYPTALERREPVTFLYPFMLAAVICQSDVKEGDAAVPDLDLAYNLLRKYPALV